MQRIFMSWMASLLILSGNAQGMDEDTYDSVYTVDQIPDSESFEEYTVLEKKMDSTDAIFAGEGRFRRNRARFFMQSFSNGRQTDQDSVFYKGIPTLCFCRLDNDTLKIMVTIGFFGGMGVETLIFKNNFTSNYLLRTRNGKLYKYHPADTTFTNELYVENKFQTLILDHRPTFKPRQQLTGFLSFTSGDWYEHSLSRDKEINYIKGRMYFTCSTQ